MPNLPGGCGLRRTQRLQSSRLLDAHVSTGDVTGWGNLVPIVGDNLLKRAQIVLGAASCFALTLSHVTRAWCDKKKAQTKFFIYRYDALGVSVYRNTAELVLLGHFGSCT